MGIEMERERILSELALTQQNTVPLEIEENAKEKLLKIYQDDALLEKSNIVQKIRGDFLCPINKEVMANPVFAADGYTYEKEAIEKWLVRSDKSPMTNLPLDDMVLIPNYAIKSMIENWKTNEHKHRTTESNVA